MAYLLNINVFITAHQSFYGFDFCPGFWDWLLKANSEAKVYCVDKVVGEVDKGKCSQR